MNVTFTDEELTRIRRAHNIEEKDEGYHIRTNEEMRNEIIIEAYVSGHLKLVLILAYHSYSRCHRLIEYRNKH
jgi:predicted HTH domain antitoxin